MSHNIPGPAGYQLSDDPHRLDLEQAHRWIGVDSYWAAGIPAETFRRAVQNSLVAGAYAEDGALAAMARVVTDRATFGWICDVFVSQDHRGLGLGKALIAYLIAHPDLQGLRRLHLATRDAHGLYAQHGFRPLTAPETWMEIRDPDVYRRSASSAEEPPGAQSA